MADSDTLTPTGFAFDNSYARLPERLYVRLKPAPATEPKLVYFNRPLAQELGLDADALDGPEGAAIFSGNELPEGADPLAQAYAGHQFGNFVPQLGDGRALLLGEVIDQRGQRRDIQLKGAGRTPFSRGGDGRAALGPVLREYLMSEAMYALGIPTTRALAAVTTGESVYRERELPGAVLARVAASHVRVGTFQYFYSRGDREAVQTLADYVIERHYPELHDSERPYLDLFYRVMEAQVGLVAEWMRVGFVHGVMNTDNTAIAGETIDYGPCAFMDRFDPATVFSSIDQGGRYAFGNQPPIAQWNLARFAEPLLPLIDPDQDRALELANEALRAFPDLYRSQSRKVLGRKLGLAQAGEDDSDLIQSLLDLMHQSELDYTLTFRQLSHAVEDEDALASLRHRFGDAAAFDTWHRDWRARREREAASLQEQATLMRASNPVYIPRNHRVERALTAAVEEGDYEPLDTLMAVLSRPYEEQPQYREYADPPPPGEENYTTYCGT